MRLNAFTNGFAGFTSTQHPRHATHVEWVYYQDPFDGISLFENGWMSDPTVMNVRSPLKVGWLSEPRSYHPYDVEATMNLLDRFELVMTFDHDLLGRNPRFRLTPPMGVSVDPKFWGSPPKSKDVAMIVSHKFSTEGHLLRQTVRERFGDRIDVFGWDHYVSKAETLSPYRFVVVIEAVNQPDFFTCHLLDAIALDCVPIYWGCPNLGEWLVVEGILRWTTLDDLDSLLHQVYRVPHSLYDATHPARRANQSLLPTYEFVEDWFFTHHLSEFERRLHP